MIKHIIFDLDGTLIDSMGIWENIDKEFLAKHNKIATKELSMKLKTLSVRQSAELFKNEFNLSHSVEDIMEEIAELGGAKYRDDVQLKPFVKEALTYFKQKNIKMCIATASIRKNAIAVLSRLEILDFFDFIIAGDDISTGKDNPEIFYNCLKKLRASIDNTIVVEDSLHAIRTAKNAGFKVVAVYDESSSGDKVKIKDISNMYINDLGELGDFFEKNINDSWI